MENCVFCNDALAGGEIVKLILKGCEGISEASKERECDFIDAVHTACRKTYCNPCAIQSSKRKLASECAYSSCTLRSQKSFSYKDNCLFCGMPDKYEGKKRQIELIPVRNLHFDTAILKVCNERNDEWSEEVKGRVIFAQDLHAADAVYHQACSVNFRTGRNVPLVIDSDETLKRQKTGRPEDLVRAEAFEKVTALLENNNEEQITITDLIKKMEDYLEGSELQPDSFPYMKKKLLDHFGERLIVTDINGMQNVVTFRCTASTILRDFFKQPKDTDSYMNRFRLIEAAANIIKSDIKSVEQSKNIYPPSLYMSTIPEATNFLPKSLMALLNAMLVGKDKDEKLCSLGKAMMQAARPRVLIAPLQIGLAVQMHSHFASRFLIDTLHTIGFCSSYSEVKKYERCAAVNQGLDIPGFSQGHFI